MEFKKTDIKGVWITKSPKFEDDRGTFRECFQFAESAKITGEKFEVAQTNTSSSKQGVVRGLHFSLSTQGQWKWVNCLSGSILDVVVDIRENSPTFMKVLQIELSNENNLGILIQGNLAHGFQSLEDNSIVIYNLSSEYNPDLEFAVNAFDSDLGIHWPIKGETLSSKDVNAPNLALLKSSGKLPH